MRSRSPAWTLALVLGLALAPTAALASAPASEAELEQPAKAELEQAARAEVAEAAEAFGAGGYAAAIAHYEAAMAILPAPKLHYNIAVCHQRLALEAETPEARTRERDRAIESYNAYLEQNPQADDRLEVAELIRELGGTPVTRPELKSPFAADDDDEPEADPDEADEADDPHDPDDPDAATGDPATGEPSEPHTDAPRETKPIPPRHGRVGINLLGGYGPDLASTELIDAPGLFGAEFYGGGMLGPRRRLLLAAYTQLYIGATLDPGGFGLSGYALGLLGEQSWVLGRDAILLGVGGVAALTGQALGARDIVEGAPACRLESNTVAARRSGALLGGRLDLGVLIGPRRRGMLGLVVMPSLAIWGDGPTGVDCDAGTTPWTALGLRRRWHVQLWAGAGFSFRF